MIKLAENVLSWCNNPEQGAVEQALNISRHPALFKNVCLMPDTHQGYGMPIGGVVALNNAISPAMVGVDIGCGMLAVKTNLNIKNITREQLINVVEIIKETIPVGVGIYNKTPVENSIFNESTWDNTIVCLQEKESARYQIGTLGSGNHFIEIQKDTYGDVWFMIHSGSRNLGYKVEKFYHDLANELNKKYFQEEVVKNDLAFLPIDSAYGADYITEMNLCLAFSYQNRQVMSERIKKAFVEIFGDVVFENEINIHHNYAAIESHYGKNVWVHRKGATSAKLGQLGIIPGSQGTCSYIVRGKGNPASLMSCSHGAGRKMSRKQARENLSVEEEIQKMESQGIIHSITNAQDLDEAPSAYKDIDVVMEEQKDLVDILVKLSPLAVIKGQ